MILQFLDTISQAAADSADILDGGRTFAMYLGDTGMETLKNGGFWDYLKDIFQSDFFLGALMALLMLYA